MKTLRITLEGKSYEVGIELIDDKPAVSASVYAPVAPALARSPAPVSSPVPAPVAQAAAGGHSVSSPMPGLVMKVRVAVGQKVAKDEEVLVLEAMKMESPVCAPCAGTIASILVKEGDAVSEGQVLIQLN